MRPENIGQFTIHGVQQALDRLISSISNNVEGKVKVTAADAQPDYLDSKFVPGRGLTRTVLNPGLAEQYELDAIGAENEYVVDLGGNFDFTSIAAANAQAVADGASPSNPKLVTVKPGTYTEPPMTVPAGVAIVSEANRIDTVLVVAQNPGVDLFTMTGGYVAGLNVSGVSDSSSALFRCATSDSLVVMHGVSVRGCSNGLIVENQASCILTNFSINITGSGQAVDTGIIVRGNSFLGITGIFVSVPTTVLALYPGANPVQRGIYVSGAEATISSAVMRAAYNVPDNEGVFADDGAMVSLFGADVQNHYFATRIGAIGANTRFVVQGATFQNNDVNGQVDNSTGVYQVSAETDEIKFVAVAGAKLNGLIQVSTGSETLIAGDSEYIYPSFKQVNLNEWFYHMGTTGLYEGGDVTDGGGLTVDVAAGLGYSSRPAPDEDNANVSWEAESGVVLTANATNYVYYDPIADAIAVALASPGQANILLATVVTGAGSIKWLHTTRNWIDQQQTLLHEYLVETRKIAWVSGLAVSAGSTSRKLDISAGAWYRALDLLSIAGGSDVAWTYFYGGPTGTEVPAQVDLDITNYDNAGVLTAMQAGFYRADTVIVTSDNNVAVIYGTQEFAAQNLAEDTANKAQMDPDLEETGCFTFMAIVQQGAGAVSYIDVRPDPNAATAGGGGGGGGTNDHSALLNLPADDHPQYFRTDGGRTATGDFDMGANNIGNVGTVDGVNVSGHAARHNAGGADQLAVATGASNGFMSAADKSKLDALVARGYASVYLASSNTQLVGGAPSDVEFDTNGLNLNATSDQANNRITITQNGIYRVTFGVSFSGQNNATYTFEVAVDGVAQAGMGCQRKLGVGGDVGSTSIPFPLISLTAGQQVTVQVTGTGVNMTAEYAGLSVERI